MKNPRTEPAFRYLCLSLCCLFFFYLGKWDGTVKGKEIGYERANSQNQRMAFSRAKTLAEAAYRGELNQCKEWVDGLGADLAEARATIRSIR